LRYALVMSVGAVAITFLLQFDNFLVGTFVDIVVLGYYVHAYKVAQWPTGLVTHVVARASLPTYAKLQDDPVRLGKAFEMSLWLILTVAVPIALALFVSAPDFLRLLYGDKWLPSTPFLRFLVVYSVLRPLLDDTGALFTAIGRPQRITVVLVVGAVTLILVATPLTLLFGALGTAVGVGVAFTVAIALTYTFVSQTIPVNLVRTFWPAAVASAASLAIYFTLAALVDLNVLPLFIRVIFKGSVAAGAFTLIIILLEGRAFFDRITYIWRLLTSRAS
jgi:lipopolysaccharide exporter